MSDTPPPKQSFVQEFMAFLKNFGIIGLAIAFIIGAAASKLVTALVNDLINPIVGLVLPSGDLKSLETEITNTASGAISVFKYGDFIAHLIDFAIIALIVFILYKVLSKFKLVDDKTKVSK
ncbi:MAG: MscL family protein [Nitrosarchaeum sp.]|nr:MscL family protein [Nitrosarchaeum sp.]